MIIMIMTMIIITKIMIIIKIMIAEVEPVKKPLPCTTGPTITDLTMTALNAWF